MIIVVADDQTVSVFPDLSSVRAECEAVDVEEGAFLFFDNLGRRLIPRFTAPVRRTQLIFKMTLVGGGNFELDLDPNDNGSCFDIALADISAIEPNRWFGSIEDLITYVKGNRQQALGE